MMVRMATDAAPTVTLTAWDGPWPTDEPDANFKTDVALYSKVDGLATLTMLGENLNIRPAPEVAHK
jgi:hypothetical protein